MGSYAGHHGNDGGERWLASPEQGGSRCHRRGSRCNCNERCDLLHPPQGRLMKKLTAVAVFGLGYVLGGKAGRGRDEQIRELAQTASKNFEASDLRERLETYRARLEAHSRETFRSAARRSGERRVGEEGRT